MAQPCVPGGGSTGFEPEAGLAGARRKIAVALQGGGSHGAYTWGVLDRLLEDDTIEIEALSGASAGAVNALVFAQGYTRGGREGAQRALAAFWSAVGNASYGSISG